MPQQPQPVKTEAPVKAQEPPVDPVVKAQPSPEDFLKAKVEAEAAQVAARLTVPDALSEEDGQTVVGPEYATVLYKAADGTMQEAIVRRGQQVPEGTSPAEKARLKSLGVFDTPKPRPVSLAGEIGARTSLAG